MRINSRLFGLLLLVFTVVAPLGLPGFVAPSAYSATVSQVLLEGGQRVDRETIMAYMQLQPGSFVSFPVSLV